MNFEFLNLKNLLKSSYHEACENIVKKINELNLLDEVFDLGLEKQNSEEVCSFTEKYSKILDELKINSMICITNSFEIFLKSFINLLKKIIDDLILTIYNNLKNSDIASATDKNTRVLKLTNMNLQKLFSLFYNMYMLYYSEKEHDEKFNVQILLHNNISVFKFIVNFYIKIDMLPGIFKKFSLSIEDVEGEEEVNNENQSQVPQVAAQEALKISESIRFFIEKLGEFSEKIISEIFSKFLKKLSEEFSEVENFEGLHFERKYKKAEKMFKKLNEYIIEFFDYFQIYANEKDFFYNLNYSLCLFFDVLNKKILAVKDFSIDDLGVTANFLKTGSAELKKGLENIMDVNKNTQYKLKYSKILDLNKKYIKFEEIIFILNSGLKDIRSLVINSNKKLNIDSNELISLIEAIFEKSDFRDEVKEIILQYLKK